MAFQGWHYAIQRIDILIVSISGAGVYTCLETLKFSEIEKELSNTWLLKAAGFGFVLAIIVNFVSQFTGKIANEVDMVWTDKKLQKLEKNNQVDECEIDRLDRKADKYTIATNVLNMVSFIAMSISLIFLTYFFIDSL